MVSSQEDQGLVVKNISFDGYPELNLAEASVPAPAHLMEIAKAEGFEREVDLVSRVIAEIAYYIREERKKIYTGELLGRTKTQDQLVSEVDERVDEIITEVFKKYFPGQWVISEEGYPVGQWLAGIRGFILDSLDGSGIYLNKEVKVPTLPAVLAAFCLGDQTKVSIAFCPWSDDPTREAIGAGDWFYSGASSKAYKNGKEIQLNADSDKPACVYINRAAVRTDFLVKLEEQIRAEGVEIIYLKPSSGMALRMMDGKANSALLIHENHVDSVIDGVEIGKQGKWDVAAPEGVIHSAGGVRLNLKTGEHGHIDDHPQPFVLGTQRHCDWLYTLTSKINQ
jgi:fructose-1,6-bisphosphatase/inositol monophosphatase family enzyme